MRRWGQVTARPNAAKAVAPRALENMHRVMSGLFDKQRGVVADTARRIALFCPRRAGKTGLLTPWIVQDALDCRDNEATIFVIGPTLEHAKALLWRPLENLSKTYNLGLELRGDPARCNFPNGVVLYFRGAKDREQLGVLRGFKSLSVNVDEVQDIRDDLLRDIETATGPGLRDLNGSMRFSGTPGRLCLGSWYDITTGSRPNWSVHTWSMFDNPFLPDTAKDIDTILREEGLTVDDPRFKREYLGLWVEDGDELVYRWDLVRNGMVAEDVVLDPNVEWHYVMAVDFGYNDASAGMVGAFSFERDEYYEVDEFAESGLTISDLMNKYVMPRIRKYNPMRVVGDAQARQTIEEINQRWGIGMVKGDKLGKLAFIELMNSDMRLGRVKTPIHFNVVKERQRLVWDPAKRPMLVEHPRRPNHLCDAGLYAYREAKHWIARDVKEEKRFATYEEREAFYLKQYILQRGAMAGKATADWANDDDFYGS